MLRMPAYRSQLDALGLAIRLSSSKRLPGLNMDTHVTFDCVDPLPLRCPLLLQPVTLKKIADPFAVTCNVPIGPAHTPTRTVKPRLCVTHLAHWGVFTDAAVPRLCICCGSRGVKMCGALTCCHVLLAAGTSVLSEAHIVWRSFSHILFLLCLKCSMTLYPE